MLWYNKNYTILALNYIPKNSKKIVSALEIKKRYSKTLKRAFVNIKE